MDPLESKVRAALKRAGYFSSDSKLVVAVSGGPDSLALLHSLMVIGGPHGLGLHIAHLNHDMRGELAFEDARFVAQIAKDLDIPSTIEEADPLAYQKQEGISSFEEAAREVRYSFLAQVAGEVGADAVAVGHTSDDLAETVLMRVIRGSGLRGLRGMEELSHWRSRNGERGAMLFRPLLDAPKDMSVSYCRSRCIQYVQDPWNLLPQFTRNRVRHHLMPVLSEYNPAIREALVRLSHAASLTSDYMELEVARAWLRVAKPHEDTVVLETEALRELHPLIRIEVLRRAYVEAVGNARRLGEVHLTAMSDLIFAPAGRAVSLPRGFLLRAEGARLWLGPADVSDCPYPPLGGSHRVHIPSKRDEETAELTGWTVDVRSCTPPASMSEGPLVSYLNPDKLEHDLWVRGRRPGDRFQPLGMVNAKKLQDFFVDEKVPRTWRDRVPLLVSESGVAWVVGYRVSEWARAIPGSHRAWRIEFIRS